MNSKKQYIVHRKLRTRYSDISEMTLWRWEHDERLAFPRAVTINGSKYYDLAEIEAWERSRSITT